MFKRRRNKSSPMHVIVAAYKEIQVPSLDDAWQNILLDADLWPEILSAVLVVERVEEEEEEEEEQPIRVGSKWRLRRLDASSEKMVYTLEYSVTSISNTESNRTISFSVVAALCPRRFMSTSTISLEQLKETDQGVMCRLSVSFAMTPYKFSIRSLYQMRFRYKKVIKTNIQVDLEDFAEHCESRLQRT